MPNATSVPPPAATSAIFQLNNAGNSVIGSSTSTADSGRGRPYYEKLRKELRDLLNHKRKLDANLSVIEDKIAVTEADYLEETTPFGNIIRGFDGYMKSGAGTGAGAGGMGFAAAAGAPGTSSRRKTANAVITDQDQIFSRSSAAVSRDGGVNSANSTNNNNSTSGRSRSQSHSNAATPGAATPGGAGTSQPNSRRKNVKEAVVADEDERPTKKTKTNRFGD